MPSVLAPADSPNEDQFTLASVAVEFETNLRSAFDEAADESAADADAQPAAGGPARRKGVLILSSRHKRGCPSTVS